MEPKMVFVLFLLLSSWVFVGHSEGFLGALATGGNAILSMKCMKKLLTCQPYLRKNVETPPVFCCYRFKEMVSDNSMCLCAVINNPDSLKFLSMTKDDAMRLSKDCGADADFSTCKTGTGASSNSTAGGPTSTSAAYGISPFSTGAGFVSVMASLAISAF